MSGFLDSLGRPRLPCLRPEADARPAVVAKFSDEALRQECFAPSLGCVLEALTKRLQETSQEDHVSRPSKSSGALS